jgi:glycosyltransferase involved in cell wall biosynthesis
VASELYYPEDTSTGYYLTRIAEGLATEFPVRVLCAQPTYAARGQKAPSREERNGVLIERCPATSLDKDFLPFRLVNLATISLSLWIRALRRFRGGDTVVVVTNPPLLPFLVAAACRIVGARCVLLIHDVYPEVLVAMGLVRPGGLVARLLGRLSRRLYRGVDHIVALGRDMAILVGRKLDGDRPPVSVIPHWADLDRVAPVSPERSRLLAELGLEGKFVIQYSGNMGRTHDIETIVAAARRLTGTDVHFLFIGPGAKKRWLDEAVRGLANVTVLPAVPRAESLEMLGACHLGIIAMMPGMAGVSVPSRLYNVLASGRPVLAVTEPHSELALVVAEEDIGWVTPPGDDASLVHAIEDARQDLPRLHAMGARARAAAERRFSFSRSMAAYKGVVSAVG